MLKLIVPLLLLLALPLRAAYVFSDGKFYDQKTMPTLSVSDHFNQGYALLQENRWQEALHDFEVVTTHFHDTPFYSDALYYTGLCYYSLGDFDLANQFLSRYLTESNNPRHFQKAFEYKYQIAEQYAAGARKHLLGKSALPKLMPARDDALALFDEVVASLPSEELAAKALFSKANFLYSLKRNSESIENFSNLTRRFPKHPLALESFLKIADVYLEEIRLQPQNPDLISLAKVNRERFQKSFPGEECLARFEENIVCMEELYSHSLYETGRYWERKNKPKASALYYRETLTRYPGSTVAKECHERLSLLEKQEKIEKKADQKEG